CTVQFMGETSDGGKVEVFQIRTDKFKADIRLLVTEHMDQRLSGEQAHRNHLESLAVVGELRMRDRFLPDSALQPCHQNGRITRYPDPAFMNDRHRPAKIADVGNNVRGEDNNDVLSNSAQQVVEAYPFFRI